MTPDEHARIALDAVAHPAATQDTLAVVHALIAIDGRMAAFTAGLEAMGLETLAGADHPPVPEQALGRARAAWIVENADLWAGWTPGAWPAHDQLDPRGFRWEHLPKEEDT